LLRRAGRRYDRRVRAAVLLGVVSIAASCGGGARDLSGDLDADLAPHPAVTRVLYTLWWNGARIGDAEEQRTRDAGGVHLVRRERVQVRRGDGVAASRVTIEIDADAGLRATAVRVSSWSDGGAAAASAERDGDGDWRVQVDGEPARREEGALVPAELASLLVARDGRFDGDVLLPGRGFAVAHLAITPAGDHHRALLTVRGGELATRLTLDRDGAVLRAAGADGVVAVRATAADVAAPFVPPEVVDGTALVLDAPVAENARRVELVLDPVDRAPPPLLPGQRVVIDGARWQVTLDAALPGALPGRAAGGDRTAEIVALVDTVDRRLEEDLAVTATTMAAARRVDRGDCTTHALLFAALAGDAGIDVQLVTGFRVVGDRLVRHRWAVAWTGAAWLAVDPTHGEAPAHPVLLGLAVHGARADEVALAGEAAFAGTGSSRAGIRGAD